MVTNLDFGLDGDAISREFSGILSEDSEASEGFNNGTERSELENSALDPSSASSIPSWPLPPTTHTNPSMVKPMLPPSKVTARPAPKEHSAEEWKRQRITFTKLYTTEDKPLKEVMNIMENEYGFRATLRQYKRRIEQWKRDTNIKENDMRVILRKDLKRKHEGKKTPCYIDCDTPAPIIEDEGIHNFTGEDSTPDLNALSALAVESYQDREIRIVDTRKTVLNQFLRIFGMPNPIDLKFDFSIFKYPPEIDDLSDEKFERLICDVRSIPKTVNVELLDHQILS
ncbi:hypothetical protein EAF00_004372 [Botryotinia globosa]|nr:hypothetical protein EAF00_004372 [Botryotinia globosa]